MKKWANWLAVALGIVVIGAVAVVEIVRFIPSEDYALEGHPGEDGQEWVDFSASEIEYGLLEPGNSYTQSLMLTNKSDDAVELELTILADLSEIAEVDPSGMVDAERKEIIEWLRLANDPILKLAPGESENVNLRVRVPVSAAAGGQYAVLTVRDNKSESKLGVPVGISAVIDGDDLRIGGELRENNVAGLSMFGRLDMLVKAENSGNATMPLKTEIAVRPLFGGEVLYEDKHNGFVLPGTTVEHDNRWIEAPVMGIFNVTQKVTYVNTNGEQVESTVNRVAIVLPFWLVVTVAVVIVAEVVYFVIRALLRRKQHRQGDKSSNGKKKSSDLALESSEE